MAENQTRPGKASVTAFIAKIKDPVQRADAKELVHMMSAASGDKAVMWGPAIVGFGSYHYKYETGREGDMMIIGFSPRKAATVLYGMTSAPAALLAKLGKNKVSGSCLHIKRLSDVDLSVLARMMAEAVAATRKKHV